MPKGETIGLVPNKPRTPVSTFRIPLELKARAIAAANANGTTLTAVIIDALELYAKKNKPSAAPSKESVK